MRPKKTRWIRCDPGQRCFKPECRPRRTLEGVNLTIDEFEALRLADFEGLKQEAVAEKMKIHRSTVSRILESARKKLADALVNIKAIKIAGGCCKIVR